MLSTIKRFALHHPRLIGSLAMLAFVVALNVFHGGGGVGVAEANWSGGGNLVGGSGP